jgi:hypothetical protein
MSWALYSHSIITGGQEVCLADLTLSHALRNDPLDEFIEGAERRIA